MLCLRAISSPRFTLGFPRTLAQAQALDQLTNITKTIHITLERWVTIEKLRERKICKGCGQGFNSAHIVTDTFRMPALSQCKANCSLGNEYCEKFGLLESRSDDTEDVIKSRLEEYDRTIAPLLKHYDRNNKLATFSVHSGIDDTDDLVAFMLK